MLQRNEFIARLAEKGYTKHDAGVITDDFVRTITEILAEGEGVMLRGFGIFEVRDRKERGSVSPKDSTQRIVIPAYKAPHFTPGKVLKKAVRTGVVPEE